jgi:RimJ/RimL family protein N-acetyltransferase
MRNPMMIGERVYLRPLEASDGEEFARHAADETETFMNRGRSPESPLSGESWIAKLYEKQPPSDLELAVCLRADDRLIGSVGLEQIDWVNRTAETGSWLTLPEYRGKGYGTEAKHLLLEYTFDVLQLHVLWSEVWEPNTRSAAALVKQGYRPAGRRRWQDVKDGVLRDMLVFDVKRDEWLAARAAWQASRDAANATTPGAPPR